jgi:hypothetical protein
LLCAADNQNTHRDNQKNLFHIKKSFLKSFCFSYLRITLCEKKRIAPASIWTITSFLAARGRRKVTVSPTIFLRVNLLPLGVKSVIRILSVLGSVIDISRSFTVIVGAGPLLIGGLSLLGAGAEDESVELSSFAKANCAKSKRENINRFILLIRILPPKLLLYEQKA